MTCLERTQSYAITIQFFHGFERVDKDGHSKGMQRRHAVRPNGMRIESCLTYLREWTAKEKESGSRGVESQWPKRFLARQQPCMG